MFIGDLPRRLPRRVARACAAAVLLLGGESLRAAPPTVADASDAALRAQRLVIFLNVATVTAFAIWWWRGRRRAGDREVVAVDSERFRAGLLPHLARWMSTEIFHRMASHREALVKSQQQAEADMAQLEARLARIHAPLEDRLHAYETRIVELERELTARNAENRELIEAKIHLTREKLAAERRVESEDQPRRHGEHGESASTIS